MAIQFYRYSFERAEAENDIKLYNESQYENRRCRDYIQDDETGFYANAYKENCVDSDGSYTRKIIGKFGMERVMNMYAVTEEFPKILKNGQEILMPGLKMKRK